MFRGTGSAVRAQQARRALVSEPWQRVQQRLADDDILSLPTSPLPLNKMRGYLGPTLTDLAAKLAPGDVSEVLADGAGHCLLLLVDLQRTAAPALDAIRDQVSREYLRRAGDNALREYLDQLRDNADIEIDEAFLRQLDVLDAGAA